MDRHAPDQEDYAVSRPILSVVIPSYNGRHLLEPCLASLRRFGPNRGVEVLVADDASTDGTASWVADTYPEVRVVRLTRNGGFCEAANAGVAAASGELVQLLNNDAEVCEGWFEAGLRPFANPEVGSVAPLVLVRSNPSRVDSAGDQYALVGWPSKRGHGEAATKWLAHPEDRVFGASGSSAIYRAEALARVGGYDPAFGSYYEDIDLAFRLRWAGYSCAFAPGCLILHEVSASYDHARPDLQRRMARNAEILFWTNLPAARLAAALIPHLGFTMAQAAWRLARGRFSPFALGKLDALRALPKFRGMRAERVKLARSAIARPHFPMSLPTLVDARNHLKRPGEASARSGYG